MIAHYHYAPDFVLYETTFGRMLALFDCALAWVKLTNPMGGGDDVPDSGGTTRTAIGPDQPGAIGVLGPMVSHAVVKTIDQVDPDVRDLISPDYQIRGEDRR